MLTFSCQATLPLTGDEIAERILDLGNWPDFRGYGPIPGIKSAEFALRTPSIIGTRVRVTNDDNSTHVEEIVQWQPDSRLRLVLQDFSPPLSRLATRIDETWTFEPITTAPTPSSTTPLQTRVTRTLAIHAKSLPAQFILRFIVFFLQRAIARHLRQMAA